MRLVFAGTPRWRCRPRRPRGVVPRRRGRADEAGCRGGAREEADAVSRRRPRRGVGHRGPEPEHPRDPGFRPASPRAGPGRVRRRRLRGAAAAVGARHRAPGLGEPALLAAAALALAPPRYGARSWRATRRPARPASGSCASWTRATSTWWRPCRCPTRRRGRCWRLASRGRPRSSAPCGPRRGGGGADAAVRRRRLAAKITGDDARLDFARSCTVAESGHGLLARPRPGASWTAGGSR